MWVALGRSRCFSRTGSEAGVWGGSRAATAGAGSRRLSPGVGGGGDIAVPGLIRGSPQCRGLHGSPVACGNKNLLKKFASKTKKKFWYESPSLGTHLTHNPSSLESLMKRTSKKTRKEDSIRKRALDGVLYQALSELISTFEVNEDVHDLNVEFSKVSLAPDFSACRVYWKTSLSAEQNDHTEAVLQKSASRFRHLLIAHQVLRNVPPIVFIRDKESAAIAEVNRLLEIADFGPSDEKDLTPSDPSELKASGPSMSSHVSEFTIQPSLFGIDHEALHKQIMEYKRNKGKRQESVSVGSAEQEQEQVSMLQKQMKKKMKKAKRPMDDDITPQEYFLNRYYDNQLDKDDTFFEEHKPEYELQESLEKLELEDNNVCKEQSSLTTGLEENKLKKC
ncbi:putative ribosome-binding factor A, mitochondrial [Trichosurus vulpecula]|uniref:putative ribosome-binding factor A, mitochondrial n=1 Tax=Trichosurus vulpecula TaxID=9337 RepID=UPI00186B410A|nr:putative ribosome-binding factor A, mitochondrial [Trichosurus vulpecula]